METADLKELAENYWPNQEVLKAVEKISLVGTVGATASGKSTVMEKAINLKKPVKMKMILSDVSRAKRPEDEDGKSYHFRDKDQMIRGVKKGIYVQVALMPDGGLYATRPSSYPEDGYGTMAIMSHVIQVFRRLPFKNMRAAFIVPYSYAAWRKWLDKQARDSSWSDNQLAARISEAKQSYEFALSDRWMNFVLNDEPEKAGKRLMQVAVGEVPDLEDKAKKLAGLYLNKIKGGTY